MDTRSGSFDDTGTFKTAKDSWEARTGGKVQFNVFSEFNDFDKKYTGYIATKDGTTDVLYTYDAFTQIYGPRPSTTSRRAQATPATSCPTT